MRLSSFVGATKRTIAALAGILDNRLVLSDFARQDSNLRPPDDGRTLELKRADEKPQSFCS